MQTETATGWDPKVPYNELPPPPAIEKLLTPEVRKQCTRVMTAHQRIRDYMASSEALWDKRTAWLTVPAIEAMASSRIEGIYTTPEHLIEEKARPSQATGQARSTLNLETAISTHWRSFGTLGDTTRTIAQACSQIKGWAMAVRDRPGTCIAGPQGIVYTPPFGSVRIHRMLENLWKYLDMEDQENQLTRIAAAHHQFEAIHPFEDGNGRTGRLLNLIYLGRATFSNTPLCAPSIYMLTNVQEYYDLLTKVRASRQWHEWVLFMLRAFEAGVETVEKLIERQTPIAGDILSQLRIGNDRLARAVSIRPYLTTRHVVDDGMMRSDSTARKHLLKLRDDGVLIEHRGGRTGAVFANPQILATWS